MTRAERLKRASVEGNFSRSAQLVIAWQHYLVNDQTVVANKKYEELESYCKSRGINLQNVLKSEGITR